MKTITVLILSIGVFNASITAQPKNYAALVNPFIGAGGHGHTFPGVSAPFGMVQLSPDTRVQGWDACSGYHYSDSTIIGFSHTHLSGTGAIDYGDILLKEFSQALSGVQARYVRVIAKNLGVCPAWHYAAGGKAWLFVDEIVIE